MRWFWVDRFTEYVGGSHARGVKAVGLSDDYLHSHFPGCPVMPNSLIGEGMAQTAGLLASEAYGFRELLVLAKFTKLTFDGPVWPGDLIEYHATIGRKMDAGAQCTVVGTVLGPGEPRQQGEAEIFFARLSASDPSVGGDDARSALPTRLFDPSQLARWLRTTGVFAVGVREDGQRMTPEHYGLPSGE